MLARGVGGRALPARGVGARHERSQTSEAPDDVVTRQRTGQDGVHRREQELLVFVRDGRSERVGVRVGLVRQPDEDEPVGDRNREHVAAKVPGHRCDELRRRVTHRARPDDEVRATRGRDGETLVVLAAPHPRREHDVAVGDERLPRQLVGELDGLRVERTRRTPRHDVGAVRRGGAREGRHEARVVLELAVGVAQRRAAAHCARDERLDVTHPNAARRGEDVRRRAAEAAQPVREGDAEVRDGRLTDAGVEHHRVQRPHEMRRDARHQVMTLARRLVGDGEVTLCEIAQAAMDELAAPPTRPCRQIDALDECRAQPARRRVERHADTRHPGADDDDVVALVGEAVQCRSALGGVEAAHAGVTGGVAGGGRHQERPSVGVVRWSEAAGLGARYPSSRWAASTSHT